MRTSLNEIKQTEQFLQGQLTTEDTLLFEAKLLTNPLFKLNMLAQKKVYQLVKLYQRKKIKTEVETASKHVFSDPEKTAFQSTIHNLFNE